MNDPALPTSPEQRDSLLLLGLILFQSVCGLVFVVDIIGDLAAMGPAPAALWHLVPELAATVGLVSGVAALTIVLLRVLRRQARMARGIGVAQGALADLMTEHFRQWDLTPSETDVATFTIKGFSIAEIARLRGSAEATVKTHLNAIYRKSGLTGRGQLVSVLIEDLLGRSLIDGDMGPAGKPD